MNRERLTRDQEHWQGIARRLASDVLAPRAAAIDREGTFPRQNFAAFAQAGLLGLPVGEELGGPGADVLTTTIVTEALAQGCASSALCYHMHIAATTFIVAAAEGDQIDRFVLPILRGEHISTYAISEPGSGSRWWHMESFVEPDGAGGYVYDGYKSFATSAGHCDSYVVPTRASPTSPHNEFTILLIDRTIEGVEPVGVWDAMGMRGNSSTPVRFNRCRVPATHRLGEAAFGFPLLMAHGLPVFQIGLAAVYLGLAQSALDFAIAHVTKRVHADTGLPLAKVETVQRYVAEMAIRIDRTRSFVYRVARYVQEMIDEHEDLVEFVEDEGFLQSIAQVKVSACEAAQEVTHMAVQVCGGQGYGRGYPMERYYRDARAGSIMGPNDDMLKNLIGQRALGLPYPWE
mgnify:FL=1